jgi:hypothetical protein
MLTKTSNETSNSQTCQLILEATCWALPIVPTSIAGIGVAPSLQTSVVNVLG